MEVLKFHRKYDQALKVLSREDRGDHDALANAYDTTGNTALLGDNLRYEMLCVSPGANYRD